MIIITVVLVVVKRKENSNIESKTADPCLTQLLTIKI